MRFLQAYANSAVCSATRTALITGRYQYRLDRAGGAAGWQPRYWPAARPSHVAVAVDEGRLRHDAGRKVALGKLPKFGPLQSGYDHFYGFRGGAVDYYTHSVRDNHDLWDDDVQVHKTGYLTDLLGDRAVEVVNGYAKAGSRFC